jgi:hypothetical protein
MRDAAADLEFEEAARLRDEIKRLEQMDLALADDRFGRAEAKREEAGKPGDGSAAGGATMTGEDGSRARTNPSSASPMGRGRIEARKRVDPGEGLSRRRLLAAPGVPETRARRNDLDEMTIRRTEVPSGGRAHAAGAPMRPGRNKPRSGLVSAEDSARNKPRSGLVSAENRGPRKPSLDSMGPGTDRETPLRRGEGPAGGPRAKSRPHQQDAREAHDSAEVPLTPEDRGGGGGGARPKPRSIGGRAGSHAGKRGRR